MKPSSSVFPDVTSRRPLRLRPRMTPPQYSWRGMRTEPVSNAKSNESPCRGGAPLTSARSSQGQIPSRVRTGSYCAIAGAAQNTAALRPHRAKLTDRLAFMTVSFPPPSLRLYTLAPAVLKNASQNEPSGSVAQAFEPVRSCRLESLHHHSVSRPCGCNRRPRQRARRRSHSP